jgi:hypothetical protein
MQQHSYNPNEFKRTDTLGQAERTLFAEELPHHFVHQKYCNPQDDLCSKEQEGHQLGPQSKHNFELLVANPPKKEGRAFTAFSLHCFYTP